MFLTFKQINEITEVRIGNGKIFILVVVFIPANVRYALLKVLVNYEITLNNVFRFDISLM